MRMKFLNTKVDNLSMNGYKIYILGVAARAADNLRMKYDGLQIVGTYSPPIRFEKDNEEVRSLFIENNDSGADILAVALGSPKSEKFTYTASLSTSIGVTIDFEDGNVKRAPKWMSARLEGLYRITQAHARLIKRYMKDVISIGPIMKKYGK